MKKILSFIIFISLLASKIAFSQVPTGGTISGPATGCQDVLGSFTVSGVTATSYEWTITGVEQSSINNISPTERSIIFGSSNITITVIPKNASGSGAAIPKTITISPLPAKPTISQAGDVLTASTALTYQWYLNDAPISNANARTYAITETGFYEVEVTNAAGCAIKSNRMSYFTTAIKEDAKFKSFAFFPNPVTQSKLTTSLSAPYDLEFFTLTGKTLVEKKSLKGEEETDLSGINPGIYLLRVTSEGKTATRKIIIQ